MGADGLREATQVAMLNANYIAKRLADALPDAVHGPERTWSRTSASSTCAPITKETGVTVDDVAKRLIDYGFHAPTMSFPVAGTLMVEPTESEDLGEIDRFCDAMIAIRDEIDAGRAGRLADGRQPAHERPPHRRRCCVGDWPHPYTREEACYPVATLCAGQVLAAGAPHRRTPTATGT